MKFIGAHVDSLPLLSIAPREAHALCAGAFAFNLIDPKRFSYPPYDPADVELFKNLCRQYGFSPDHILPHSAFVVNLCSPDSRKLAQSRRTFTDELKRCEQLGLTMLNFHPGAHLKQMSEDDSLRCVAESLNFCLDKTTGVTAVIENTAGQGSNIGYRLEQIAGIIEGVEDKSRVGVCIDSCHAYAADYDLSSPEGYDKFWNDFSSIIGLHYLKGMHINDSLKPLGSRLDRHAPIGRGEIGLEFFRLLMADRRLDNIPFILETPDPALWPDEIKALQRMSQ